MNGMPARDTTKASDDPQSTPTRSKNDLLRAARERLPSAMHPGKCMSRRELADAINAYIAEHHPTVKGAPLDHRSIGSYENGYYRWPATHLREAFRVIAGVTSDVDLGFYSWWGRTETNLIGIDAKTRQLATTKPATTRPIVEQVIDAPDVMVDNVGHGTSYDTERHQRTAAGDKLHRALTVPDASVEPLPVAELGRAVTGAWHTWQTSPTRYSQLATVLPSLITSTELALDRCRRDSDTADRREAYRHAADLYGLVRTVAKRVGRVDLSLVATDRAVRAAVAADDPLRLAGARWNLTQVLLSDGQAEDAETVALHAVEELQPETERGDLDVLAVHGALLLVAAIAAARRGDAWTAWQRINAVDPIAQATGERNTLWTAFGPTNVRMFAASVALEAGNAADALRLAEQIDHDRSPSIERRVAFLLDQARSYQQRQNEAGTLMMLIIAEREAPEDVRHRPVARSLLHTLVQRGQRTVAQEAARLATRVGVTF